MRKLMSMLRKERRLRLLFWGLLAALCLLMTAAFAYKAYLTYAPLHGIDRISAAADAAKMDQAQLSGAKLTVPDACKPLGDYVVVNAWQLDTASVMPNVPINLSASEENEYRAFLLSWPDYAVLIMSKAEIVAGQELTVGVRYPEANARILADFPTVSDGKPFYVFYDDVPDRWVLTLILLGLCLAAVFFYLHFSGRRYLLRHTQLGREILALDQPKQAFREIKKEMRKPILRTAPLVLLEHWILYSRFEEKRGWYYCPVEKSKVVSSTLNYLESAPDDEEEHEAAYQWTLNELMRQHRILIHDPDQAKIAENYFKS